MDTRLKSIGEYFHKEYIPDSCFSTKELKNRKNRIRQREYNRNLNEKK